MIDYPYMVSNNKIGPIINKIQEAARPSRFTLEVLKNLGFSSTNDRAIVPLLKKLSFLTDDNVPTAYYDQLRDKTTSKTIIAARIRDLYSELFAINTNIFNDSETNIKGAISRVSGKDETGVTRIYNTFKALCSNADFTQPRISGEKSDNKNVTDVNIQASPATPFTPHQQADFHYNIQIHLPATTDISVYNSIFKSMKDNLGI